MMRFEVYGLVTPFFDSGHHIADVAMLDVVGTADIGAYGYGAAHGFGKAGVIQPTESFILTEN